MKDGKGRVVVVMVMMVVVVMMVVMVEIWVKDGQGKESRCPGPYPCPGWGLVRY